MQIAICDDDINIASQIKKEVCLSYEKIIDDIEVNVYDNGNKLIDAINKDNKSFDMILLDIDMPDKTGLEVAKELREKNDNVIIVFISSHEQYVYDSFEYMPFRYIRKSRVSQELKVALKSAYTLYRKNEKKYIFVKTDDCDYKIEVSEICYMEIIKRKMYIHMNDSRIIATWKTVKDFIKEINCDAFVKIHSGGMVNMKYIKECTKDSVIMDNGEKLMTSRTGIKMLKNELARYWGEIV